MALIIDCSVALAWSVSSQATSLTQRAQIAAQANEVVVPYVFPTEIGNALIVLERRRKLTSAEVDLAIDGLDKLELEVDREIVDEASRVLMPLARTHRLTFYDAAYLELALRTGHPVATRDAALAAAVRKAGATLFE